MSPKSMTSLSNERIPDREGYLGFKDALDNGNEGLMRRAGAIWWAEQPPKSEMAQYYNLYLTQGFIDKHFAEPQPRAVINARMRAAEIKDPHLREKVTNRVERLVEAFGNTQITAIMNHGELSVAQYPIKDQLAKNPALTESQAWFMVTRDLDTKHLDYLDHLQKKFERAVDKQIGRAHASAAKTQATDALDRARRAAATYRARAPETDKERELDR
jgi:hypothetical protein